MAGFAASFCPSIFTPMRMVVRALGGSEARKFRMVLPERGLKGEKEVVIPVMYLGSEPTGRVRIGLTPRRAKGYSWLLLPLEALCPCDCVTLIFTGLKYVLAPISKSISEAQSLLYLPLTYLWRGQFILETSL
ncbi:hypothetical protein KC349_g198 [Hortaea werneckii]|nr:hypothetical protein KC349_g198 [Hortaea werneckii]